MLKTRLVLLFFFLIFLLTFSTNVLGYEIFNQNPYFDNNYTETLGNLPTGIVMYGSIYNNTWYYNATCSGLTNCTIIENNGTTQQNSLWIQKYDWYYTNQSPQWTNIVNLLNFSDNNAQNGIDYLETFLPANEEGLIIIKYRWNNTLTTPAPYLSVLDSLGNSVLLSSLNSTPNVWHNYSSVINASVSDRYLNVRMTWYWDNLNTSLMMDKFKFYTLDKDDAVDTWYDKTTELNNYCGENYDSTCPTITGIGDPCWNIYTFTNDSRQRAQLFCKDSESFPMIILKVDNIVLARRVTNYSTYASFSGWEHWYMHNVLQTRSFYFIQNYFSYQYLDCCENFAQGESFMLERISLNDMKITVFRKCAQSGCVNAPPAASPTSLSYKIYIYYNGTPQNTMNITNTTSNGLFNQNAYVLRETVNSLPFINSQTPSGSGWRIRFENNYHSANSSWFPFVSYSFGSCTPHSVCNPSTNNQTYINSDCSLSTPVYCGLCGCNDDSTYCNFPTQVGSVCDLSDPSHLGFTVYHSNCTTIYKQCNQNEICNQETSQFGVNATLNYTTLNTVCCYKKGTATVNYCFDEYGNNITYDQLITNISSSVSPSQSTSISVNPMNAIALAIGGIFGYGSTASLSTAQTVSALLISLFTSLCIVLLIITKAGQSINGNNMLFVFSLSFLSLLIMFTFISWFPSWLMIVLIVISATAFIKIGGIGQGN